MTELLARTVPRVVEPTAPRQPHRPPALLSGAAAAWTAVVGLVACVAVAVAAWFAGDSGAFPDAIRVGSLGWLFANGAALHLPSADITLLPLGALGLVAGLLYRAGRWVGGHCDSGSWRDLLVAIPTLAGVYAGIAVVVSAAASLSNASVGLVRTAVVTALLALLFGGLGALRGADRRGDLMRFLPEEARAALTGGCTGLLVLLAMSGLLLTAALLTTFSTALTLAESMHAGLVGGAVLSLVGLALVPNAVLCAGSFLVGPGFTVGTGTLVAAGGTSTGPLPAFPLLAAVPRGPGSPWLESGLLMLPILAGAAAGLSAVYRFPVVSLAATALRGGLGGLTAGLGFGLLSLLGSGSVGPGRMQQVGPLWPSVLLVCGLACLFGGAVAATGRRWVQATRATRESVS